MMNIADLKYKELLYRIAYPVNFDSSKTYPVLFFFHGAGERGSDYDLMDVNGVFKEIRGGREFPFIAIAPLCPSDTVWYDNISIVKEFINNYIQNPYVDKERVLLSGISMGGYLSWQLLMSMPSTFYKAVICCGGGMYWNAGVIKTPVWAIHGDKDGVVFVEESIKMVEAVNKAGGNAILTIDKGEGHGCWHKVFADEKTYEWLMK